MASQLCSLQKDPNRPGKYTSGSVGQLIKILEQHIEDGMKYSKDGQNIPLLRGYIRKALHTIGNTYVNTQISPISQIVESFFEQYMEGSLMMLLPEQGVYNTISKSRREALGDREIDLDYFLGADKEKNTSFIDNTFGMLADIKNKFKQEAMYKLINTFAVNRKEGRLISDIQDANIEARRTKEALYQSVREYLNDDQLEETLFDGDAYTGALENEVFKSKVLQLSSKLNPHDIEDIYSDMYRDGDTQDDITRRENNSRLYKAMMDYYTLINFDNLTNYLMGELITVNPSSFGQMTDGNVYIYTNKANHLITSWGQDGRSLEQDISKFIQALISTTPFYRYGQGLTDTGLFITFEDFYRTINRIKNLSWDKKTSDYEFNGFGSQEKFFNSLSSQDKKLIRGKSLRWLINQIRENPQKYTRIVMQALNDSDMDLYNYLDMKLSDRDYCYSIYKGFFDPNHPESIKAIQNNNSYKSKQYYQAVTQAVDSMFDVKFMQYYQNDDGTIVARPHNAQNRDQARHAIETSIHRGNTRRKNFYFQETEMDPFIAKPTYKQVGNTTKLQGISYELLLDNGQTLRVELNDLGENIAYFIDDKMVANLEPLLNNNTVKYFIYKQLKFDLNQDYAYLAAIQDTMGSRAFDSLMKLSSIVLFNKYISSVEMADIIGPKRTTQKLNDIYGESLYKPKFDYTYNEMKLFPQTQFIFDTLEDLADARTIVTGEVDSTMVRDAEGNALPTQTTSRLFGSIQSQWELIRDTQSPAAHFSLLKPGMVKAIYSAKELISSAGNKDYSKFTVAESIQANFLYDFIAGFIESKDIAGRKIIGNGSVGLLTSVNSDKGTYAKIVVDLKESSGDNTWESLTSEQLEDKAMGELYTYYDNMSKAVAKSFIELQNYANNPSREGNHKGITLDYWDNFKSFNNYCESIGKSATDVLFELTKEYNTLYSQTPIMLIDQTHFIKDGKRIKYNNTVRDSLRRFSDKERFGKFLKIKELDILKALLDEEVTFNLYEKDSTGVTPKSWLKENYPDWIGKPGNNNGKMVIAKVTVNGETFNIINKSDLEFLQNLTGLDFSKNLHSLKNFDVQLHPMLQKFNLFDFIISQEFLLSSVGSHTNHPSKAKIKVPIIFNDQIDINNDDILIFDPAEEFDDKQVLELWERYKAQAVRENKILMTSNALVKYADDLKIQGKKDFTNVIDSPEKGYIIEQALDQILDNEIGEEASRFLAQHKRNVSLTATMYPFQRHQIDGPPPVYNMAILSDIIYDVYTLNGDITDWPPFDGATFVNPLVVYWENFALDEAKAGIDKKPFVHGYDVKTGTGIIIKTAGFGLTNDRIKSHKFYRILMKNMTNRPWVNPDNTPHIVREGGILMDFEGEAVDYGKFYFEKNGQYIMREIKSYNGNNEYLVEDTVVDESGVPTGDTVSNTISNVNTNYRVWQMFGGENSMELNYRGLLVPSEDSIVKTVRASIVYGIKKPGIDKVESADDLEQLMKHSDIHWGPTVGAIKQGPANVNPVETYYQETRLNHMTVDMRQAGIQLDKEHQADNSTLSLMTQVIAGAAAKGYTLDKSSALYKALYDLTKVKTREFRDQLGNITTDTDKFDAAASHIIFKAIMNSSTTDGELIQTIAHDLIVAMKDDKAFQLTKEFAEKVDNAIPYSNKGVYSKIVTILNSTLTKQGIKQEVSGTLSVLNPTQDAIKLYKVPLLDKDGNVVVNKEGKIVYKTVNYGQLTKYAKLAGVQLADSDIIGEIEDQILDFLQENYAESVYEQGISGSIANVDIGKSYVITTWVTDSETGEKTLHSYNVFIGMPNNVKDDMKIKDGLNVWGYKDLRDMEADIVSIKDYVKGGNDLDAYTIRFSDGVNTYQSADLDILQDFFKLKKVKPEKQYTEGLKYLQKYNKTQTFIELVQKDLKRQLLRNIDTMRAEDSQKNQTAIKRSQQLIEMLDRLLNENDLELLYNSVNNDVKQYLRLTVQKVLNRQLQLALNAISPSDPKINKVRINDEWVTIDKSSIKVTTYGAIMPKTFKSSLGLEQHDDLETIKHNPNFFIKRLIRNYSTKVSNFTDFDEDGDEILITNYHLELKRTNGKHVYIRQGLDGARLTDKVEIFTMTDDSGKVYRVDDHNRIMYELFSAQDEVYRDYDGNEIIVTQPDKVTWTDTEGKEIIVINNKGKLVTSDGHEVQETHGVYVLDNGEQVFRNETSGLQFYIDNMEYNSFYINKGIINNHFSEILKKTINSTNTTANKLGELIQSQGRFEKNLKNAVKKQRELSDAMNDYESLYKEYESNKDLPISEQKHSKAYHAVKYLFKTGREMHTSFLKTLNIIAARIPAQNQQSFMAMRIQAYDNPDINSAYVSTYQFFLQGSDLDIDAVSLQTFTLNKGGLFVGHSPYYNLLTEELQKESEKIPFPTGLTIDTTEKNSTFKKYLEYITIRDAGVSEDAFDVDDSFLQLLETDLQLALDGGFLVINFRKNGDVKVSLDLNTPAKMRNFIEFLNEKTFGIGDVQGTIDEFALKTFDKTITEEQLESINNQLIAIINKHNLYITKTSVSKQEAIARNYLTQQTYDIIIDPINQQQAQSSVDIVTGPIKKIAATSEKATVQQTFSTGNVANKHQSIFENAVGRDDIAICATDLKGFFALTQLYNTILSGDDKNLKDKLISKVIHIGGKDYRGLANAFTNKFATGEAEYGIQSLEEQLEQNEMFSEAVKDYLIEQYFAMDASNSKSGSLSLSTDNAKELVLDKINAGTATMGMYLYGMSLGIPFETLYTIIASPFGRRITALTKGDMFNGNKGTIDVIGALDYIYLEPAQQLAEFDGKLGQSEIPDIMLPSNIMGSDIREQIKNAFFEGKKLYNNDIRKTRLHVFKYIDSFRKQVSKNVVDLKQNKNTENIADAYEIVTNQALDFVMSYANDVMSTLNDAIYNTAYGSGSITRDFEKLAMGAAETKQLGKNLRINQGIVTDPNESINQVDNMQNLIINRISQLRRYKLRHGSLSEFTKGLSEQNKEVFEQLTRSDYYDYKTKELVDIERFITDPKYAIEKINKYNVISATYNPLWVLHGVTHYKGYLETLYSAYTSNKSKMAKYRYIAEQKKAYENRYNVRDSKLKEQLGKNIEDAIDTFFRREWMKERYSKRKPTMHASTDDHIVIAFVDNVSKPRPIIYQKELQLGTDLGDANFKLWFEETVLPEMKKMYPENKFIQSLDWVTNPKNQAGAISSNLGLRNINMLPRSPYEREKFNELKKAFNDLKKEKELYKDAKGTLWAPQELLYIYSLITTNGKLSPTSLHGIFEDYLLDEPARSFHKKIAEYDQSKDKQEGVYVGKYGQLMKSISDEDIAPFSSPYSGGSDLFRSLDRETEEISIWEKADKETIEDNSRVPPEDQLPIVNGYIQRNAYTSGFNSDYFLNGTRVQSVEGVAKLKTDSYSGLSKYDITVEKVGKDKVGLVDIKAKNAENQEIAKKFLKFIRDNRKGLLPTKIAKNATTAEDLIALDLLEDDLNSMKCNV